MESDVREKILETARCIFLKEGYKGTTINSIARAAGISPSTIYLHFNGKKDLFENLDISLTEPNWDKVPDKEKENIVPGKELVKDPTITNTGINDAFVFMKVTVPAAELVTANEDGTKNEKALKQLYSWEINKGWIQLGDAKAVTENGKTTAR